MGLSSLPRLYFKGQFYWSPSTYNNNDKAPAIQQYDPTTAKLDWSFLREQGVKTDEDFREWSIKPMYAKLDAPLTLPPAEWGYYGGNQSGFVTETSPKIKDDNFSVPIGKNRYFTKTTGYTSNTMEYKNEGPWVGLPLQFNLNMKPPKLVDINPTLPWTSQVFSDTFTIGSKEKGEGFTAPVKYRMHSRWLFVNRNYDVDGKLIIAGGISTFFQTVVHKENITFFNSNPDPDSYQAQLEKGLENSDGIMIRFTAYDTLYFQGKPFEALHKKANGQNNDQESELEQRIAVLYQKYEKELKEYKEGKRTEKPKPPVNRAYSRVVGWTGLWNKGELISMAEGRTLLPNLLPGQPIGIPTPNPVSAKGLPASYYVVPKEGSPKSEVMIGPCNIEVTETEGLAERISIDMGSTMPEYDSTGRKADFGKVQLKLLDLSTDSQTSQYFDIVSLPNELATYQETAGVQDYSITHLPEKIRKAILENPFALFVDNYDSENDKQISTLALIENPVIANTNSRGVYVNQQNAYWESETPEVEFTIKVQMYGKAPQSPLQLSIGQFNSSFGLISEDDSANRSEEFEYKERPYVALYNEGQKITNSTVITVPDNGLVTISVKALQPGMPFLVFFPFVKGSNFAGVAAASQNVSPVTFYSYNAIRSLPFDNILAEEFETWLSELPSPTEVNDLIGRINQRVFDDVFRTFHLMYPVMGFIGCPMKFQEWRGRILKLTDPKAFNSAAYMPVTRSLSAGQRRILVAYTNYLDSLPMMDLSKMDHTHNFDR